MARSRNLVTPVRRGPQLSLYESDILQSYPALARSRNLVTAPPGGVGHDHNQGVRRAKPAPAQHAPGRGSTRRSGIGPTTRPDWRPCSPAGRPWLSSSAAVRDCDSRPRNTQHNTSTYAVLAAPCPLLDRVGKSSPIGYAHALRQSLKKTEMDRKKMRQRRWSEENEGRRRRTFIPAESRHNQLGGHSWCRTLAAIATARTASITRVSNGWNGSYKSRCPPNTSC